jgi:hypothetical protein
MCIVRLRRRRGVRAMTTRRQSVVAIMLQAKRAGIALRYIRTPDGTEVLEPALTELDHSASVPPHGAEVATIADAFGRRIHRARSRAS